MIEHVAIIGAGFSGTLQAINLLRHNGPRVTLIERGGTVGQGIAYGAAHPDHVLNVRAANMSAFPDEPGHFAAWLSDRGVDEAGHVFAARLTYGAYLRQLLEDALATHSERLSVISGEVIDITERGGGVTIRFDDGSALDADAAVLAVGNLPPHHPPGLDDNLIDHSAYKHDPWDSRVGEGLGDDATVLIVGTGLTMVDIALKLEANGFGGRIIALSRRGLLPRCHADAGGDWERLTERPVASPAHLLRRVRKRADAIGWRHAVDELRPFTQSMWANASPGERSRFLRHLRPWWDVHRHRLAPQVHARLEKMVASGQLKPVAGHIMEAKAEGDAAAVTWRSRGQDMPQRITAQQIVNCTGPLADLSRTTDPLLMALRDRGAIRPDAAHIGIDVNVNGQVIGADGRANDRLLALGPMTRGAFWEIVAVPDIRRQTWDVARRLSNAHWVGGEGL